MTITTKTSPDLNSPGKPGESSQNSENKNSQSPRSNPVCLEVPITIRSLPAEAGGQAQPIREEARTVIVFDNGAVVRSTNNMPIGQTVILSNSNGRDVVCRVVGGRNLPSIKGYVEVEFIEPVNDFWGIHQDSNPGAVTAPPVAALGFRKTSISQPSVISHEAASLEETATPASVSLGSAPSFEDIPGLLSMPASLTPRGSKAEAAKPGPQKTANDVSDYDLSESATPTSVANWRPPSADLPAEKRMSSATMEASSNNTSTPVPSRDFLSKGLMAYEQPRSSSSSSSGRMPLIVGVAALTLAGVGAVVFFMHRTTAPVAVAKTAGMSQPTAPEPPPANKPPEPAQAPQEQTAQAPADTQLQAQPVVVDQSQPVASVASIPAAVTNPETPDSRQDQRNVRRQDKKTVVTKQPDLTSERRPVIPNLKMGSPSAPKQNLANPGEGTVPLTEIASTEAGGTSTPAGLLTSAGRISNPPAAPGSAPAPPAVAPVPAVKTAREPKMISSVRPVYPATAKQTNVQGVVTVSASIDENGKVAGAKALNGPLLLRQAAVDAVKQWKYSPGLEDGKPAPSQVTVNVEFRLN
jgi:TonB family protein